MEMLNGAALMPHKLANRLIELDENGARVAFDTWNMTTSVLGTTTRPGQVRVSNLVDQEDDQREADRGVAERSPDAVDPSRLGLPSPAHGRDSPCQRNGAADPHWKGQVRMALEVEIEVIQISANPHHPEDDCQAGPSPWLVKQPTQGWSWSFQSNDKNVGIMPNKYISMIRCENQRL